MLVYRAFLIILVFGYIYGEYQCQYLDALGTRKIRLCETGCCGNIHHAYCCHHKYLAEIIFGSILGFFLLVVIIVVIINCCYRRIRRQGKLEHLRVTRNYGTINAIPNDTESTNNNKEQPPVEERDIVPEVEITVTPASPQGAKVNPIGARSEFEPITEERSVVEVSERENAATAEERTVL